jgi:hypothetical protein
VRATPHTHAPTGFSSLEYWEAVCTGAARDEGAETTIITTAAAAPMSELQHEAISFDRICEDVNAIWEVRVKRPHGCRRGPGFGKTATGCARPALRGSRLGQHAFTKVLLYQAKPDNRDARCVYLLPFNGASDFASGSPLISSARVTLSATIVQIAPEIR